jgi:chromosome segregation ATPase
MKENLKEFGTTFVARLDLKSVIIIILFIVCGVFYTKAMLDGNTHKEQRKELEKENRLIEKEKNKIRKEYETLLMKFEKDSIKLVKLESEYEELNLRLIQVDKNLMRKNKELKDALSEKEKLNKDIEEFKKNPPNRTGKSLLDSIKEKTK